MSRAKQARCASVPSCSAVARAEHDFFLARAILNQRMWCPGSRQLDGRLLYFNGGIWGLHPVAVLRGRRKAANTVSVLKLGK